MAFARYTPESVRSLMFHGDSSLLEGIHPHIHQQGLINMGSRGSKHLRRYLDPFLPPKSHPQKVPKDPLRVNIMLTLDK